jgi:hypothetical protein
MVTMAPRSLAAARDPFYPFLMRALPVVHEYVWRRLVDREKVLEVTADVFADAVLLWPFGIDAGDEVTHAVDLARARLIQDYGRLPRDAFEQAAGDVSAPRARVLRALGALPPRCRQAALIHHIDGGEAAEVARLLECRPATARRLIRRAAVALAAAVDRDRSVPLAMTVKSSLLSAEVAPAPPGDLRAELYARLETGRSSLTMSGASPATLPLRRPQAGVSVGLIVLALVAAAGLFVAPGPERGGGSQPASPPVRDVPALSAADVAGADFVTRTGVGPVTAMPIYPPARLPFEVVAVEPTGGSLATVDLADGVVTVYQSPHSLLASFSPTAVAPFEDGWMALADGSLWWFSAGIDAPPTVLLEADNTGLAKLEYVVASTPTHSNQMVWAVQPGPGYGEFDEPSIVNRIPVSDPRRQTVTLLPPDVRPVVATDAGLLVNQAGWIEFESVQIEDPATRKMMVVAPDGDLIPLWSGLGIDYQGARLVWSDCLANGEQCRIVVSEVVAADGGYTRGAERSIGDSAVSLLPLRQPGVASVSPDGRRLVVERRFTDGRTEAALVLVDLVSGDISAPIGGSRDQASRGPGVVWSGDGEWLLVVDDAPTAIRIADGFTVTLWDWIPAGMEIRAIAPR